MISARHRRTPTVLLAAGAVAATVVPGASPAEAATNLIRTPGIEGSSLGRVPGCWTSWNEGATGRVTTTRTAHSGDRALEVDFTGTKGSLAAVQSSGCAPAVQAGYQYDLSVHYRSTQTATLTLFRKVPSQGWLPWTKIASLKPSGKYVRTKVRTPVVPADSTNIRWGLSLSAKGRLLTDDYSMNAVRPAGLETARAAACKKGSGKACQRGLWKVVKGTPKVRSIHAVMLHTGKVLLIAGSGNNKDLFNNGALGAGRFTTQLLNPKTGRLKTVYTPSDFFCAGHVQLPNGKVLVMGGTKAYPSATNGMGFKGLETSYLFDPKTEKYVKTKNNMQQAHWYPSATAMADGDVYSFGGWQDAPTETIAATSTEHFNYQTASWDGAAATKVPYSWGTYPGMILMQDGRLFYTGSYVFEAPRLNTANVAQNAPAIWNPRSGAVDKFVPGLREPWRRDQSMSVLLPPAQDQRVMTMGGGDTQQRSYAPYGDYKENHAEKPGHHLTDIVNLKTANPKYVAGPNIPKGTTLKLVGGKMRWVKQTGAEGKMYPSAVILPDGKVLETGGGMYNRSTPVREASIYDPARNRFLKGLATDPINRTYHSMGILLPDGRVITAGENPLGANDNTNFNTKISVFYPPYLFKKGRPTIKKLSTRKWKRGGTYTIATSGPIARAALIRPAAVTHSSDPNQRYVALDITRNGKLPRLKLDGRPNITPPGWYMLFVTNAQGVPSVAKWVQVR